jgi:hypothetical protein
MAQDTKKNRRRQPTAQKEVYCNSWHIVKKIPNVVSKKWKRGLQAPPKKLIGLHLLKKATGFPHVSRSDAARASLYRVPLYIIATGGGSSYLLRRHRCCCCCCCLQAADACVKNEGNNAMLG